MSRTRRSMQACRALRNVHISRFHTRALADVASDPRTPVSVLLHKTASLLPRALSNADEVVGPESSLFWSNILDRSIIELSSALDQVPSKATISVCGFDKWARSHHLVTALLEDPFTSDPTYSDLLRDRWKDAPSCVNIEHGKLAAFSGELSSPSSWLERFPHPIRLIELPDLDTLSSMSDETDSLLLNSDVLVLLCDPIVTSLSDLAARAKHLLDRPNTILVFTSGSTADPDRSQFVSRLLSRMGCRPGYILYVDPRQALGAVTALQANPASPSTIDRYQRDMLGSQMSTITTTINEMLSSKNNSSETSLKSLRQETVLSQVHGSLSACFQSVQATEKDMDRVASKVDDVMRKIKRVQEGTRQDIFGKPGEEGRVEKALSLGTKDMNALLGSFTFRKMVWRIDEIGALVSAAVEGRWCKGLENQLIQQTGCLEHTQREMTMLASNIISAASLTTLRSVVLENEIEQLKCSPNHILTPSSLTRPIHDRRSQLIQHTTTKLHREAQSAVVGVFGGILSGAGLGWWLAFGDHIISLGIGTEMGTAIGSGAFLALSSLRWAVGKWERAKQRWTQDSARIGEGLVRDLQSNVQGLVDDSVTIVASTTCKGMQDLIDKRRKEARQLHGELSELDTELQACSQFPALWTPGLHTRSVKEPRSG